MLTIHASDLEGHPISELLHELLKWWLSDLDRGSKDYLEDILLLRPEDAEGWIVDHGGIPEFTRWLKPEVTRCECCGALICPLDGSCERMEAKLQKMLQDWPLEDEIPF